MEKFTEEEISQIKFVPVAREFNCSPEYVSQIVRGEREQNSDKSKQIARFCRALVDVYKQHNPQTAQ